jgi:hypothetical protein
MTSNAYDAALAVKNPAQRFKKYFSLVPNLELRGLRKDSRSFPVSLLLS